jgi:hypothetical protein
LKKSTIKKQKQKTAGGVAEGEGPKFKPQNHTHTQKPPKNREGN